MARSRDPIRRMVLNGRVLGNGESRGAARGTRTPDPRITNAMLYRLSYCGTRRRSKRAEIVCSPYLPTASLAMLLTLEHPTCGTTLHRRPPTFRAGLRRGLHQHGSRHLRNYRLINGPSARLRCIQALMSTSTCGESRLAANDTTTVARLAAAPRTSRPLPTRTRGRQGAVIE